VQRFSGFLVPTPPVSIFNRTVHWIRISFGPAVRMKGGGHDHPGAGFLGVECLLIAAGTFA
jgi:hypothetical protein